MDTLMGKGEKDFPPIAEKLHADPLTRLVGLHQNGAIGHQSGDRLRQFCGVFDQTGFEVVPPISEPYF